MPTVTFSTNAKWPCGLVYRLFSSSPTGFRIGADSWNSIGTGANIIYSYYACGF